MVGTDTTPPSSVLHCSSPLPLLVTLCTAMQSLVPHCISTLSLVGVKSTTKPSSFPHTAADPCFQWQEQTLPFFQHLIQTLPLLPTSCTAALRYIQWRESALQLLQPLALELTIASCGGKWHSTSSGILCTTADHCLQCQESTQFFFTVSLCSSPLPPLLGN